MWDGNLTKTMEITKEMKMELFYINDKCYLTNYCDKKDRYEGFFHLYQGSLVTNACNHEIRFKNFSEFKKYCRATEIDRNESSSTGNSIKKYYMTKGGYCVVKKFTQEEIYINLIAWYEFELEYSKAHLEDQKKDLKYHEKNLDQNPEFHKYNIEYIQSGINWFEKDINKYKDLIKEYNSKLQELLKKED